jgi:hypothetical protein
VEEASRLALESIPVAAAAVSSTTFALIAAGIIAVLAGVFACGCYRQQVAIAREGHLHAEKAEVMKTPAHAGSVHFDASKNSNSASNISQHHRRNSSRFGMRNKFLVLIYCLCTLTLGLPFIFSFQELTFAHRICVRTCVQNAFAFLKLKP